MSERRGASRWQLAAAATAAAVAFAVTAWLNRPLENPVAPLGIVSLQLAGSADAARAIVASWGEAGVQAALRGLAFDVLYPAIYAAALFLFCRQVGGQWPRESRIARLGRFLAWLQLVAAGLDLTENAALLAILRGAASGFWPAFATACAVPKYGAVGLGLTYVLLAGAAALARGRSGA